MNLNLNIENQLAKILTNNIMFAHNKNDLIILQHFFIFF